MVKINDKFTSVTDNSMTGIQQPSFSDGGFQSDKPVPSLKKTFVDPNV